MRVRGNSTLFFSLSSSSRGSPRVSSPFFLCSSPSSPRFYSATGPLVLRPAPRPQADDSSAWLPPPDRPSNRRRRISPLLLGTA
ncbi:hypothetical protein GUJ93_ZPchr0004g39073 [Zizania palustris]|uniref:Uncharacterized protein n=1 Tax=Zizania palustris TaxID=103762 RepID=A0A8J5VGD4_ZIZPA|nr:hypothetical protein GUJ93_ZPchr0004g39073 [Zizania palustris]